jgi:hypothetical protein
MKSAFKEPEGMFAGTVTSILPVILIQFDITNVVFCPMCKTDVESMVNDPDEQPLIF